MCLLDKTLTDVGNLTLCLTHGKYNILRQMICVLPGLMVVYIVNYIAKRKEGHTHINITLVALCDYARP